MAMRWYSEVVRRAICSELFFSRVSLVRSLYLNRKLTRGYPWTGLKLGGAARRCAAGLNQMPMQFAFLTVEILADMAD